MDTTLSKLLQQNPNPTIGLDHKGDIVAINDKGRIIFACPRKDFIAQALEILNIKTYNDILYDLIEVD